MAEFQLVEFTTDTKTYNAAGAIVREPTALGFHFVNTGSTIVYINNLPLYPSGVFDTMFMGYKDKSLYNIKFDSSVQPIVNPELTVITFNQVKK
jgi:hypothetical protein